MKYSNLLGLLSLFAMAFWTSYSPDVRAAEDPQDKGRKVDYTLENSKLFQISGSQKTEIPLPARATAIHRRGAELYVALGPHGVVVFSLSGTGGPKKTKSFSSQGGRVIGFFEVDGRVWMKISSTTGAPVDGSEIPLTVQDTAKIPGPQADLPKPVDGADEAKESEKQRPFEKMETPIRIQNILLGEVTLNVGAKDGVKESDRFTVFRVQVIEKKGDQTFTGKQQVAVLTVTAVNENTSLAVLSRGDRVLKNDEVRPFEQKNRQWRIYPKEIPNVGEVTVMLRPLLNVNGNGRGFGALNDATVTWWGKHYFLNFRTQPLAFGWTENGNIVSSSILGEGGYNGRAFAVGIGAGIGVVNGDMDSMITTDDWYDDATGKSTAGNGTKVAFALSQTVRLGARDGLNLVLHNHFLYYNDRRAKNDDEDDSGFIYGGTNGRLNIPLSDAIDLFLSGGGGRMGYAFGEIGIFAWITGKGDAGSWGLSAAAGGAGIWTEKKLDDWDSERTSIAGPLISLGVTHRFGKI